MSSRNDARRAWIRWGIAMAWIVATLFLFWIYRFRTIPADYMEYAEVDLASLCLLEGRRHGVDAEALYREVYARTQGTTPRVSLSAEIHPMPLEMLARVASKELLGTEHLFRTFKLTHGFFLFLGAFYLFWVLGRILSWRGRTIATMLFISSFPLIGVGRVSGRLAPMLSSFLVAAAVLHLHGFLTRRRKVDGILAGVFTGLSFFNQLHSSTFVAPCLLGDIALVWIFRGWISKKDGGSFFRPWFGLRAALIFLSIVFGVNAALVLFTRYWLRWNDPSFLDNLSLIGSYSKQFVYDHSLARSHGWEVLQDQLRWYLQSYFWGPYHYYTANHLEEFNPSGPLFSYAFSVLLILGTLRFFVLLRRRSPHLLLFAIPWGLILVHVISILAHYSPLPPRYMMSFLMGYILLAVFGFKMLEVVLRLWRWPWVARKILAYSLLAACFVLNARMLYGGDYARTGGNTLLRSVVMWSGNQLASEWLMSMASGERLNRLPVVCGEEVNRAILGFCVRFQKLDGFHAAAPVLKSRESFLQFCLAQSQTSAKAAFLFYPFAQPRIHDELSPITLDLGPSRSPDLFSMLFDNPKPDFVVSYPADGGYPIRGYSVDLSFLDARFVRAPVPRGKHEEISIRPDSSLILDAFFGYHPHCVLSWKAVDPALLGPGERCDAMVDFLDSQGRPCGHWTRSLLSGRGKIQEWPLVADRGAEFWTLRIERTGSAAASSKPWRGSLSVGFRDRPEESWTSSRHWISGRRGARLYDGMEVPGMKFRTPSPPEVERSCPLLVRQVIQKRFEGGVPPLPFSKDFLEKRPRFLVVRMKVEVGDRFDLFCRFGKELRFFSIPVTSDGTQRDYVVDLESRPRQQPAPTTPLKADVEEFRIYGEM